MLENTRGGLIPYRIQGETVYICLMKPSNVEFGGDCFQLAKGHRENGESDKECAIREAIEELGLKPSMIGEIFHVNDVKKISWWAAEYNTFDLDPHSPESRCVQWFTLSEAFSVIRDWQRGILVKFIHKLRSRNPGRHLV